MTVVTYASTSIQTESMTFEHDFAVSHLEAVDGGVDVAHARVLLCSSKLLHSLPPEAQHVHVPFTKHVLEGWRSFMENSDRGFSNCVAALKVTLVALSPA
jgi:hypothetical protein